MNLKRDRESLSFYFEVDPEKWRMGEPVFPRMPFLIVCTGNRLKFYFYWRDGFEVREFSTRDYLDCLWLFGLLRRRLAKEEE